MHHVKMAEALEKVLRGEITRLILTIPPRYGKTTLGVENLIAHGLSINASAKFMHLSASASLALENSEKAKDIVKSQDYRQLFPEVVIKQSTDSKAKWYTEAGGGVYAAGAAGQVTGFGAGQTETDENKEAEAAQLAEDEFISAIEAKEGFAGAVIIDDPVKPDDADSDVKRVRVNNRYFSTIKNRINSKKTPIIIIMQRLHEMDLAGYVQDIEPGEWTVVDLPALYVDENGELQCLDPTKHTVADLQAMECHPDVEVRIVFQRQFQQNPQSREGLMFALQDLRKYDPAEYDPAEYKEYVFNYTDPANKGGDDLCSIVAYLCGKDIYIHDVIYNTDGTDINGPRLVDFITKHQCNAAEMEANFNWVDFGKKVQAALQKVYANCRLRLFDNTANKHTRILAESSFIRNNFLFRSDWQTYGNKEYRKFMINLTAYRMVQDGEGKAKHDDAPDSCAGVAAYFNKRFKHLFGIVQKPTM